MVQKGMLVFPLVTSLALKETQKGRGSQIGEYVFFLEPSNQHPVWSGSMDLVGWFGLI